MNTGNLTPKSNDTVLYQKYTGNFGQPDGFGSILELKVNTNGDLCLTLHYTTLGDKKMWSVMLNNEQREHMAEVISKENYHPVFWDSPLSCPSAG